MNICFCYRDIRLFKDEIMVKKMQTVRDAKLEGIYYPKSPIFARL